MVQLPQEIARLPRLQRFGDARSSGLRMPQPHCSCVLDAYMQIRARSCSTRMHFGLATVRQLCV
jgi:hypothetical protein